MKARDVDRFFSSFERITTRPLKFTPLDAFVRSMHAIPLSAVHLVIAEMCGDSSDTERSARRT